MAPLALAPDRRERGSAAFDHLAVAVENQAAARALAPQGGGTPALAPILGPGRGLALDLGARRFGRAGAGPRLGHRLGHRRPVRLDRRRRLLDVLALAPLLVLLGQHPRRGLLGLAAGVLLGALAR